MNLLRRWLTRVKPSLHRCLPLLALLLPALAAGAEGGPLTEAAAVERALARPELADALDGEIAIEQGRGRAAGATPNPELAYVREQLFGVDGASEDALTLAQAIDLGGRRGLHEAAGETRARAAGLEGDAARRELAAQVRLQFHAVLHGQGRVRALQGWLAQIELALGVVTRREERGDAASWDRRRLERERLVAGARLEAERAALERGRATLQALLGPGATVGEVTGALLPEGEPAPRPTDGATDDPALRALELRAEAATGEATAAGRWWAPELRLTGGWKGVQPGPDARADGVIVGAALALPIFDRSDGLARLAEGEARVARGRRALLAAEREGARTGAREEAVRLRRAALELREHAATASVELVRIATAGYEGGELGVLELLDAHRGAAEDTLATLDLEHAARRARIDLDRLTGAGTP